MTLADMSSFFQSHPVRKDAEVVELADSTSRKEAKPSVFGSVVNALFLSRGTPDPNGETGLYPLDTTRMAVPECMNDYYTSSRHLNSTNRSETMTNMDPSLMAELEQVFKAIDKDRLGYITAHGYFVAMQVCKQS
ncbi:hypothetical protein OAN61_00620 [bacterium]|nr:hypothetical protein [bacterium]